MSETSHGARALVEKIGIEAAGAELRDAHRQIPALRLRSGESIRGVGNPLVKLHPSQRPAITLEDMAREIKHQQCAQRGADDVPGASA